MGISSKDDIDIYDYINTLSYTSITRDAVVTGTRAKSLVKVRIRRELSETADRIKEHVTNSSNEDLDSIIASTDAIYSEKVSSYSFEDDPQNVFDDLELKIEERGNNPTEDTGLATTYDEFNRLYGGLRSGWEYLCYSVSTRPRKNNLY